MKIAVLSDIHSAAVHFREALEAARTEGFDRLVILGDLFTYGPDPVETLEIAQAAADGGAIFIRGNHDLLYGGDQAGSSYAARLPRWIAESVDWTCRQLGQLSAVSALPWQDEWQHDGLLFAHANPFGIGNWTYLKDEQSFCAALVALQARGLRCGVFGHVHRFRIFEGNGGGVATVGSIGQPRDKVERFGQWAMVTIGGEFSVAQRPIARDWRATVEQLRNTSLSEYTKERLCQFYQ